MTNRMVAMIPARLGSQRVKKKNLRLIDGKPLIWYAIEACKNSGIFSDIYVNSEADEIGEIAVHFGAKFYKRPAHLSTNEATNDGFALDFMNAVECSTLIQVNPTSPFISPAEIREFVSYMQTHGIQTLHSVKNEKIEGLFEGRPLNFDPLKPMPPSQLLTPVQVFSSGIMGFDCDTFRKNMKELGCAVYGGRGSIGYFALKGYATIDIDNEEDFVLAEVVAKALKAPPTAPKYYEQAHRDVHDILSKDGVKACDLTDCNLPSVNIDEIRASFKESSWSKRVVNTSGYSATLICQNPGEGNRRHLHPDRDEWWVVFDGEIDWEFEQGHIVHAKKNDIVFAPKGVAHSIRVVGTNPAIRFAISIDEMEHVFV